MIKIMFLMNGAKPPRGGEFLTLYLITHLRKDLFQPILVYAFDGAIVKEIKRADIEAIQLPMSDKITGIYPREIRLYNPVFILTFLCRFLASGSFFKLKNLLKKKTFS